MTTYRRGHDASLARYNARKRELRASMLEYSEHMRHIQAHGGSPSRLKNKDVTETALEIRAQGHYFNRHADRAFLTRRLRQERRPGKRPASLDEKELQLNSRPQHQVSKRDTKSERAPITIPTALPPLVNPPNSPDFSRKGDVRVNFVSASDLYDLVDFGAATNKTPRKDSTRISNVNDGIKLIEGIELQNQRERNIAWEKHPDANSRENSPSRDISPPRDSSPSRVTDDILTGKRIQRQTFPSKSKDSSNNPVVQKLKSGQENKENGVLSLKSGSGGVSPLNLLLEHAAASHMKAKQKVHTRPKRAKRMQLHKSNLVVIPEDGGTFVSPANIQSSSGQESGKISHMRPADETSKSSSLATSSPVSTDLDVSQNPNVSILSIDTPRTRNESPSRSTNTISDNKTNPSDSQKLSTGSLYEEKTRKAILKRSSQGSNELSNEGTQLPELIVTNSTYLPLPWENNLDTPRDKVKHVTFDPSISRVRARRKMKRLVFLQDQPEEDYKHES